ncbi:MAG: GtrA family protein [Hydrogenibacillus schlegelii]|nr:GtrA family protein [Hydrogenibacillus schlegelii]
MAVRGDVGGGAMGREGLRSRAAGPPQAPSAWRQGVRYLAVGVVNTLVGTGAMLFLLRLGVPYWPATAGGFALGLGTSFALNRRFTFGRRGDVRRAFGRFLLVTFVGYGVAFFVARRMASAVWGGLSVLAAALGAGPIGASPQGFEMLAVVIGTGLYTILTFVGHRMWTFREPRADRGPRPAD